MTSLTKDQRQSLRLIHVARMQDVIAELTILAAQYYIQMMLTIDVFIANHKGDERYCLKNHTF